jgi:hypothetical protein
MADRSRSEGQHGVRTGVVAAVLAVLALVIVAVAGAVRVLSSSWDSPLAGANAPMDMRIAGPQLQSAPQLDRSRFFADEQRLLDRYEWIDREKGIARIPIDEAMRLVAKERAGKKAAPGEGP